MRKRMIIVGAAAVLLSLGAETVSQLPRSDVKGKIGRITPEMRQKMRQKIGNMIEQPGSQKGKIAFINTQSEVSDSEFAQLAASQSRKTGFNIVFEKASVGAPESLKAACKADVAIIIVADDTTPALLAAVEDGWAVVNVRKLSAGLATDEARAKFLGSRSQKEVLRALAAIGGGMASQYPDNIMDIAKIPDLDLMDIFIPNDVERSMRKILAVRGVTPVRRAFYSQACKEGWAHAPTNDVQKAIWEKVHAIPDKPITIEFDPKKDK